MKLSKLFMIALLVGTMGVIGCGDDSSSGNGGNGNGGNGTACDPTVEDWCATCDEQDKIPDCESSFNNCLAADPGANVCEKCAAEAILECKGL